MGLWVTDLLAQWRFCGGNVSWLTHDFYMTKHYLTAFNEHLKWRGKGATACTNPHPSLNQWQYPFLEPPVYYVYSEVPNDIRDYGTNFTDLDLPSWN